MEGARQDRQIRPTPRRVLRRASRLGHGEPAGRHHAGRQRIERRGRHRAEPEQPPLPRCEHGAGERRRTPRHDGRVHLVELIAAEIRFRRDRESGRRRGTATENRRWREVLQLPQEPWADPRRWPVVEHFPGRHHPSGDCCRFGPWRVAPPRTRPVRAATAGGESCPRPDRRNGGSQARMPRKSISGFASVPT